MERDSFVFYKSFYEAIEALPSETQMKIVKIICDFAFKGIEPTGLKGIEKAVFSLIKPVLESNNKRYVDGQKGGRPKTNSKINKKNHRLLNSKTTGYETTKPNVDVDVDVDVNEDEDVKEDVNENEKGTEKEKTTRTAKTTNDSFFNSPKTKTAETTNGKQQTATTVPKGYQQLVDYLQNIYGYNESKAKLVANRVQSDKFVLTPEHCESFACMSQEDIIKSFDTMKKIKKQKSKSSFNSASRVLGNA